MDIEKLEQDSFENREVLGVMGEIRNTHAQALQLRQKLVDFEARRALEETELDKNPGAPDYAAAKAVHAERRDTNVKAIAKWDKHFKP